MTQENKEFSFLSRASCGYFQSDGNCVVIQHFAKTGVKFLSLTILKTVGANVATTPTQTL